MIGHLALQGVQVQWSHLRGSIYRVDPLNTTLTRRSVAIRILDMEYRWEIRWRFVIHGIRGYSLRLLLVHQLTTNWIESDVTRYQLVASFMTYSVN